MNEPTVTDTVLMFLDRAAVERARMNDERFRQELFCNCVELGMGSPLEHLFWIAMTVLCEAEFEKLNPEPESSGHLPAGIFMTPQARVGRFRVDFLIERHSYVTGSSMPVVVELDGHAFHDKNKEQRAYEKSRDRFLVKQGFRILHYTGSEVVADPFKAAHEVMVLLGATGSPEYDPKDPLGVSA